MVKRVDDAVFHYMLEQEERGNIVSLRRRRGRAEQRI
jgi:hypothetical protein